VRLAGARIDGAINLEDGDVKYHLRLRECSIPGRIYLHSARTRQVSLVGSHLAEGLDASLATIEGNLRLISCRIRGGLGLRATRITGALRLNGAHLSNGCDFALDAQRMQVEGDVVCNDGFEADGEVNLRGARIAGDARFEKAVLRRPGARGIALRFSDGELGGSLLCDDAVVDGQMRLRRCRVGGSVWLFGARLRCDGGFALFAGDAQIGVDLWAARGFTGEGGVDISDIHVTGQLRFDGARLEAPAGDALLARGIDVDGDAHFSMGFHASGPVRFNAAKVGRLLNFQSAHLLSAPDGFALTLTQVRVRELDLRLATPPAAGVDLTHARTEVLRDDPASWPTVLRLDGLRYEQLQHSYPVVQRLRWIQSDDRPGYRPQPFEQLADAYRRLGHDDEARRVLLAKQRARRRTLSPPARIWGALQDAVVGYGYRPVRALGWLAALLAVGTLVFGLHHPVPTGTGTAPPFNPLIYSLDLLLPVINFGVGRAYTPQGGYQWLAYLLTAAGWVLATTIAAGVARAVNRS
jgi:hypothetical protein